MRNRSEGDPLEKYIEGTFPHARRTLNSGAVRGDGDLLTPDYLIEAKTKRTVGGISFTKAEVRKAKQQALKKRRVPVLVIKNEDGDLWAAVPYAELRRLARVEALVADTEKLTCDVIRILDRSNNG